MKNVEYIIVGDGYAAMFFAHQLIKNNKTFLLFSDLKKGASQISAGVINPVVLKKFTTFWLAAEQIRFLKNTLAEIEQYTGENYLIDENIHRIFHDENEKILWLKKAETEDLQDFLNPEFKSVGGIVNPFGTGKVNHSARLNVNHFFKDYFSYLKKFGHLVEEKFDYSLLQPTSYKEIQFNNIVFCEGIGVRNNPYFEKIPIIPNKGHHLKVTLSQPLDNKFTLKKKHFLFPVEDGSYYYGGTYDPNEREQIIDDFKTAELVESLTALYPDEFIIQEINFGFRPTVKDRRPILGNHKKHKNYYVYNGLGARGILNGCYFSLELFNHIEHGTQLMPEVDIKRFEF